MGSIVKAECGCGFEKEMSLGGGMRTFATHCNFPFFCSVCAIMFEANLLKTKIVCPKSKATNSVPYDSDRICLRKGQVVFDWNIPDDTGRRLELTDGDYWCPSCGRPTMTFLDMGCWD